MRTVQLTILSPEETREKNETQQPDHEIDLAEQAHGGEDLTFYLTKHLSEEVDKITIGDPWGESTLIWFE